MLHIIKSVDGKYYRGEFEEVSPDEVTQLIAEKQQALQALEAIAPSAPTNNQDNGNATQDNPNPDNGGTPSTDQTPPAGGDGGGEEQAPDPANGNQNVTPPANPDPNAVADQNAANAAAQPTAQVETPLQ